MVLSSSKLKDIEQAKMGAEDEKPVPGPPDGSFGKDDGSNNANNNNNNDNAVTLSRVPPASLTDAEMKARSARPSGRTRSTATASKASLTKASSSVSSTSAEATETTKLTSSTSDRSHRASRRAKQQQNPGSLPSSTDAAMRKKIVEDNVLGVTSGGNSDMVSVTESMAGTVETASGLVAAAVGDGSSDVVQPSLEPGAYRVSGPEGTNDNMISEGGHDDDGYGGGDGGGGGRSEHNGLIETQESAVESSLDGRSADRQQLQVQSTDNGVQSLSDVDPLAIGVDTKTTARSSIKNDTKDNDIEETGLLSGDAVVAQLIDETDLEQQYRDQFMKDVVEASVVDKDVELAREKRRRMFLGISVVVIALALGLGLGLGLKEEEPPPPTAEEVLYDLVSPWSSPEDLADPSSPQSIAFNWVLNEDPLDLTGGLLDGSTNTSTVLERYVLSVLYWSTDGPNWTNQLDFMTNSSVCDWPDESKTSTVSYVNCNENGDLFDIRIDSNSKYRKQFNRVMHFYR